MDPRLNRRELLKTASVVVLGASLGACARTSYPSRRFAKVKVSPDRVIRTTVGLRPFRASGFVVRGERFGDKTVIHNYGHGSNGVSMSWGTGHLAMEEALKTGERTAAVIGCGAVGLATARLLQRQGLAVTIYAKDVPPRTTSNMSAAWFSAGIGGEPSMRTPEYVRQHNRSARLAHRYFQDLVSDHYGVRWIERYSLSESRPEEPESDNPLGDLTPENRQLAPDEHPFPRPYARHYWTMLIEPAIYLDALLRDVLLAGGRLVVREFPSLEALLGLPERLIMNCTGLGAKALFGDEELTPIKGQLTVLLPQPEVDYILGAGRLSMIPRRDGIALGQTWERGESSLEPSTTEMQRVMGGLTQFFADMAS
jgi:glycine/D-amino acid oxidase-like deaminating enzyme